MENIAKVSSTKFAESVLPLLHGHQVKIRIDPTGREYNVSKDLLCKQSSYFAAMFGTRFSEGKGLSATMEEIEGVVSVESFESLLQWLYLGRVTFAPKDPSEEISAVIEFARLADMCDVTGMEETMAQHIKEIIIANPGPRDDWESWERGERGHTVKWNDHDYLDAVDEAYVDINTHCLTSEHINSATCLPTGHPVRHILAAAAVEGYLSFGNHKFRKLTHENLKFAADLLHVLQLTLKQIKMNVCHHQGPVDPIRGEHCGAVLSLGGGRPTTQII
ncbi:hypothetical protein PHISCL_08461 [Aspergillus sclerotialis]|uniref:BTB domain-containing protein n=1 Tax=Aspergillus sclerotialis TaxID=2070753 RepID=A0A3A2ZMW3_9EURO|nr:hypothetical protein PHISCL_08461 [Aspergillus sclerotialis]